MREWVNKCMHAWVNEWINACMNEWMCECVNECEVKRPCTHNHTLPHHAMHQGFWFGTIRRTTSYFRCNIILHCDIFFFHYTVPENEVIYFKRGRGVWARSPIWFMSTGSFFQLLLKICLNFAIPFSILLPVIFQEGEDELQVWS